MKPKFKSWPASLVACCCLISAVPAIAWGEGAFRKVVNALTDTPAAVAVSAQMRIEVGFSPGLGAELLVIKTIHSASDSILVLAYSFTSKPIAEALIEAAKRGVKVYAVLDKSQRAERYTSATFLANSGVSVKIDDSHASAHNKIIIVDGRHTLTGSYNFTNAAASRNAENVLTVWNNSDLAKAYDEDFRRHWNHATDYSAKY